MDNENLKTKKIPETCPHCGQKLSPWQQVLLRVDRMITCKNCWYRIMFDKFDEESEQKLPDKEEEK